MTTRRRLRLGYRISVYLEPRDLWLGVYVAPSAVYVCPLPMLVFRWQRIVAGHFTKAAVRESLRTLRRVKRRKRWVDR